MSEDAIIAQLASRFDVRTQFVPLVPELLASWDPVARVVTIREDAAPENREWALSQLWDFLTTGVPSKAMRRVDE